jgi:hypothetical protein
VFAPPIKTSKIKTAAETGPLRPLSRRLDAPTSGQSDDLRAQAGGRSLSWDFSKIPVFAPRPTRNQTPHPFVQPKLVVGEVDDPLEHEADHVADQVMRMPEPGLAVTAGPPQLSRKCADCEEEDKLRRNPSGPQAVAGEAPEMIHQTLRAPGRPLDAATRAHFEPRFGHDFSRVRIHSDASAAASVRSVDARAYTFGSDIVFAAGAFLPGTSEGRRLLAHELAHTVQQGCGAPLHAPFGPDTPAGQQLSTREPTRAIQQGEAAAPRIQRQPDYTKPQADVASSGLTRLEVHGLAFGTSKDFAPSDLSYEVEVGGKKVVKTSDEKNKTDESARQMAVVILPDALTKPDAVPPEEILVVLHFHGWTFRSWDPYAGYRIGKDKGGTVRDVDQEHLEQQIGAFSKSKNVTVVGILAQGVGKSDFYDKGTIPTFEYVRDVLLKSKVPALEKIVKGEKYSVVLSAHSGGGSTQVIPMMAGKEAETADRSRLTPQEAGKDGRVVDKLQPVKLITLVEALNGDTDVNLVMAWVNRQLDRLVPVLKPATSPSDVKALAELAATPKLRGYFGDRAKSAYAGLYSKLNDQICSAIEKVPEAWRPNVGDLFRIIKVTDPTAGKREVEHEQVISGIGTDPKAGTFADALIASLDPTSDRAKALPCSAAKAASPKEETTKPKEQAPPDK